MAATVYERDNCFAAPSSLRRDFWGRSAGSFPKQLLVIEPTKISNTLVVRDGPLQKLWGVEYFRAACRRILFR